MATPGYNSIHKECVTTKKRCQAVLFTWWKVHAWPFIFEEFRYAPSLNEKKLLRMPTGEDNPRSPAKVNRYLTALYHALAVAFEQWEWLHEAPAKTVERYAEGVRANQGLVTGGANAPAQDMQEE